MIPPVQHSPSSPLARIVGDVLEIVQGGDGISRIVDTQRHSIERDSLVFHRMLQNSEVQGELFFADVKRKHWDAESTRKKTAERLEKQRCEKTKSKTRRA
jgi:hypothetical protein